VNGSQRVAIILGAIAFGGISASAAPPESISGLALGSSIQEVKAKYGSKIKRSTRWKEDIAESKCGMDKYEIDIPEFNDEYVRFFNGKLFAIEMSMNTSLSISEMYALARRFIAKYGPPTSILCVYSNEPAIETHSINECEFKPSISLSYESGSEKSEERHEFWISIYSDAENLTKRRGYEITLQKGRRYYNNAIEPCRKKALLAIDEEKAGKITLPD